MSTNQKLLLNQNLTNERVSMPYPHIMLLQLTDAVPLLLPELPKGDVPVLCDVKGTIRQIGAIKKSALVFNDLRKISELDYVLSESESRHIANARDAVEVLG